MNGTSPHFFLVAPRKQSCSRNLSNPSNIPNSSHECYIDTYVIHDIEALWLIICVVNNTTGIICIESVAAFTSGYVEVKVCFVYSCSSSKI